MGAALPKYLTEFIGTFFLVMAASLGGGGAAGATLMVMVYMGGHVSGAHYNPAVSVAVFIRGKLSMVDFIPYLIAQGAGGLCGGLIAWAIAGAAPGIAPAGNHFQGLLAEVFGTFALALVVLNVATSKKTEGNSYYGLAIGGTVLAMASSVGRASGGAFNPAVGLITVVKAMSGEGSALAPLWMYLVGPAVGGAAAAIVFKMQEGELAVSLTAFKDAAAASASSVATAASTPPAAGSTPAPGTPPSEPPKV